MMTKPISLRPVALFYSYAQEDEALCSDLEHHLSQLKREGLISSWYNRAILPGADWTNEMDEHLHQANIILLLISPDFLASDYCYEVEMQRQAVGEARVIPVLLRPCDWSSAPFGTLQALPRNGQFITTWRNQDEAFTHIAQQIRLLLTQTQKLPSTSTPTNQNRARMCQRLQQWYQDYLTDSLQQAAWLDLDLAYKPDALSHPLILATRDAHLPEHSLPAGTSIIQVYEDAHQELLILGEPGSGKSTQLYTLAQYLLRLAEADSEAPLPLIFALSSWAVKRSPLDQWMVEQLTLIYQVPKLLARQWVANHQIIPLLDGLDEMEEMARPQCIAAVNRYHQNHLHPLVVCSRSTEYAAASQSESNFSICFQQFHYQIA